MSRNNIFQVESQMNFYLPFSFIFAGCRRTTRRHTFLQENARQHSADFCLVRDVGKKVRALRSPNLFRETVPSGAILILLAA